MRPSKDETWLKVAAVVAERGTCARRRVGCVLVDLAGNVIATGYNGVARGMRHCIDVACSGVGFTSGQGLEKCEAIHAEQNALLQCKDVQAIHTCYVTVSPCIHCVKMLMNTGCRAIVFLSDYPDSHAAMDLWINRAGLGNSRRWVKFNHQSIHPRKFDNISW